MMREDLMMELERACRTLRRMKFPRNGAPPSVNWALGSHMPEPLPDRNTAYGSSPERLTRIQPTKDDLDHFDRTWPWMLKAPEADRSVVFVRLAFDIGWRRVGKIFGCSHETARYRFNRALDEIARSV